MRHTIKAFIHRGEKYWVAECQEIAVVTQGKTLDETISNLQEAVKLHLEGEDLADFDLALLLRGRGVYDSPLSASGAVAFNPASRVEPNE